MGQASQASGKEQRWDLQSLEANANPMETVDQREGTVADAKWARRVAQGQHPVHRRATREEVRKVLALRGIEEGEQNFPWAWVEHRAAP